MILLATGASGKKRKKMTTSSIKCVVIDEENRIYAKYWGLKRAHRPLKVRNSFELQAFEKASQPASQGFRKLPGGLN